jgi:hypothetical protein
MENMTENPIVLRYGADGHIVARLPLMTMLKLPIITKDETDVIKALNAGHHVILEDGSWIELESRHC